VFAARVNWATFNPGFSRDSAGPSLSLRARVMDIARVAEEPEQLSHQYTEDMPFLESCLWAGLHANLKPGLAISQGWPQSRAAPGLSRDLYEYEYRPGNVLSHQPNAKRRENPRYNHKASLATLDTTPVAPPPWQLDVSERLRYREREGWR
jgi:hypothetical protein